MMGKSHAVAGAAAYLGFCELSTISTDVVPGGSITLSALALIAGVGVILAPQFDGLAGSKRLIYTVLSLGFLTSATWLLASTVHLHAPNLVTFEVAPLIVLTFLAAEWSIVPDIDEPNSTIGSSLGPVSRFISEIIRGISGGHRLLTHSLVAILASVGVGYAITLSRPVAAIVVAFSTWMMTKLTPLRRSRSFPFATLVLAAVAGTYVYFSNMDLAPMMLAIPFGVAAHILGDYPTNSGVVPFYPFSKKKYGLGLFAVGKEFETNVLFPVLCVALAAISYVTLAEPVMTMIRKH